MLSKAFPALDHILHFILAGAILVCQLLILYREDAPSFHTPEYPSLLAIVSVVILLILHLVEAMRSGRAQSEMSNVARNLLVAIALIGEFLAVGLDRASPADKQIDSLTLPSLVLGGLSLMRIMDSLMDFEEPSEALSVQCMGERFGARTITVHFFLLASSILQSYKYSEYQAMSDIDSKMRSSEQTLDLVVMILLWIHVAIYPLNALIRISGLDRWFKMCMPPSCLKNQYTENCDSSRDELSADELELVAITRVPIVRHIISGTIIASFAYITGIVFGKLELTYQLPALLFYLAADVIGRNFL